ncbi:MAG: von Willebrand factor, type [Acidobacteriales bacterium]|nr:von Willebrand factor, type [Terriglobales bacterium]
MEHFHAELFNKARVLIADTQNMQRLFRHSVSRRIAAIAILFTAVAVAQDVPTFSSNVKVVNLLATVRDKHGQIVNTLTKDDFALAEDGRPQTIHYFTRESDLPLTLGLLVDTSLSQRNVLEDERVASRRFLNEVLRIDKDKAFIIHFDREVELLQDLTSSLPKLQTALDNVDLPENTTRRGGGRGGPGGRSGGGGFGGAGTLLYDAVYLASDEVMKPQQGRKAVIILSDGVDTGSKLNVATAIESAQKSDTIVYSILFADKDAYGGGGFSFPGGGGRGGMGRRGGGGGGGRGGGGGYPQQQSGKDGKKILQQLAKETGGSFFEVSKKEPIEKIYAAIQEELRSQYSLGYTPDRTDNNEGFHKISLTAKKKDLVVQTRDNYYARK